MCKSFKRKKERGKTPQLRGLYVVLWASEGAKEDFSFSHPPLSSLSTEKVEQRSLGQSLGTPVEKQPETRLFESKFFVLKLHPVSIFIHCWYLFSPICVHNRQSPEGSELSFTIYESSFV